MDTYLVTNTQSMNDDKKAKYSKTKISINSDGSPRPLVQIIKTKCMYSYILTP